MPENLYVLIPAAGIGARLGSPIPKQYLQIADRFVLEHVVSCFDDSNLCSAIHIAVSRADTYFDQCHFSDKIKRVWGGDTRQASVFNLLLSLKSIAKPMDWVLVHDAARPTLSHRDWCHLIHQLKDHDVGGILAKPVSSTIKYSQDRDSISRTIDRDNLWEALTPQMFRYKILYGSLQRCQAEGLSVTDESQAVELSGFYPKIIEAQDPLLKLTHASDLAIIEAIIQHKHKLKDSTICA